WYTGSAGWLYRVGLEGILGLRKEGQVLWFEPAFPQDWEICEVNLRIENKKLKIQIQNPARQYTAVTKTVIAGRISGDNRVNLAELSEGEETRVEIVLG